MYLSTVVAAALSITSLVGAAPGHGHGHDDDGDVSEYYSLGCPKATKPHASKEEQLQAITEYGQLLYIQKQIETAEYTYVANEFINHAPE